MEEICSELPKNYGLVSRSPSVKADLSDLNGLLPLLKQLDSRLDAVVLSRQAESTSSDIETTREAQSVFDPFLSAQTPAFKYEVLGAGLDELELRSDSRLAWLQATFELSGFDLGILIIAIAPELDRRYEEIYAYLQGNARYVWPTVDLALALLCPTTLAKLENRQRFATNTPLRCHGLLRLEPRNTDHGYPTLLNHKLHLDSAVTHFLLGQSGLDEQLMPYCQWLATPKISGATTDSKFETEFEALGNWVQEAWQSDRPVTLYVQGTDQQLRESLVTALAAQLDIPIIRVDLFRLVQDKAQFELRLKRIILTAWLQSALLELDQVDTLYESEHQHCYDQVWQEIAAFPGLAVVLGTKPYRPLADLSVGVVTVQLPRLTLDQRRECWQQCLTRRGVELAEADLNRLCDRFQLTSNQIESAVETAYQTAQWRQQSVTASELFAAVRMQSGHDLETHARKIEPHYRWEDLVLPRETKALLREMGNQVKYQRLVQETWGFSQKLSMGKGLTALFVGLPGTGKTMAAEVIAHELGLDLYKIDLSQVVSKYIGETEKNLNQIFAAATDANAVLLFDEADALFGKRTEVKDAHDRYANIETSYLLQKMEEYTGIAILTTNLQSNMDEAFVRRLHFIVTFAMPGVAERRRIWAQIWPEAMPRDADLDLDTLAERLEVSGAVIRNIALRAAYLAAGAGQPVGMAQIKQAVRWEYQKMGKVLMSGDFGG
jgi:hypothetical protein